MSDDGTLQKHKKLRIFCFLEYINLNIDKFYSASHKSLFFYFLFFFNIGTEERNISLASLKKWTENLF